MSRQPANINVSIISGSSTHLPAELLARLTAPPSAPSAQAKLALKTLLDRYAGAFPPEQKQVLWKLLARAPDPGFTARALAESVQRCGLGAVVLCVRQGFQFARDGRRVVAAAHRRELRLLQLRMTSAGGGGGGESSGDSTASGSSVSAVAGAPPAGERTTQIFPSCDMDKLHRSTSFWGLMELLFPVAAVKLLRESLTCGGGGGGGNINNNNNNIIVNKITLPSQEAVAYFDGLALSLLPLWESFDPKTGAFLARVAWMGQLRRLPICGLMPEGQLIEFRPEPGVPVPDPALLLLRALLARAAVPRGMVAFSWHTVDDGSEDEDDEDDDEDEDMDSEEEEDDEEEEVQDDYTHEMFVNWLEGQSFDRGELETAMPAST